MAYLNFLKMMWSPCLMSVIYSLSSRRFIHLKLFYLLSSNMVLLRTLDGIFDCSTCPPYFQIHCKKNVLGSIQHVLICPTGLMPRLLQRQLVTLTYLSTMLVSSPIRPSSQPPRRNLSGSLISMWLLCWQSARWQQEKWLNRTQVRVDILFCIRVSSV